MSLVKAKGTAVTANVSNQHDLKRLGITKTQKELRVVVACSLAGGTGAGAFIDVGLALRSMSSPSADKVELFAMLPSGYSGANRERVFANGFAALSELEHVMRPNPQPRYTQGWTAQERAEDLENKPYDEVYLFDTRNVGGDATEHVDDIYDMIADILFEDFGSSEFASRKRSISVNQQQHKVSLFHPPAGDDQHGVLAFAQGYSAVGQSIIATTGSLELEAAVSDASRVMLESFFGVAESSGGSQPSVKDRDSFLRSKLFLVPKMFDDFPEFLNPRPPAVAAYQLVDQLLISDDGKSIHGRLIEDLSSEFRAMREQASEPKDWASQAEKIRARYESEVLARAGSTSIRRGELEAAHNRLFRALSAEEGVQSLKGALYDLVDDRENGGLDFTIAMVEQVREELAKDQTGVRAQLDQAAAQLRAIADDIMSRHLVRSLQKLEQAAKPNLLGRIDRASAEEYLKQIETDLGEGLKYWLRATAALEAISLLEDVTNYLGEQSTPDEQGNVVWTGLLRELDEGRRSVRAVLSMIGAEARRVRDAANRPDNGVYIVIDRGTGRIADERVLVEPRAWANEKFSQFGGCRKLFPQLRKDEDRLQLINQLRSIAKEKLADEENKIPSATEALCSMPAAERSKVMELLLTRSMPWFPAQFDHFKPNGEQFKMIIAAPEAIRFRSTLEEMIKANAPAFGIAAPTIEDSAVRGKIICYCELSGVPLDAIAPLRDDWRKSYNKQSTARDRLPLHNHWDHLRFPNPVVPSNEELEKQRQTMALFLKGALYGILARGLRSDPEADNDARYYLDMSHNDFQSIGTERKIRVKGFDSNHLSRLQSQVASMENGFSALHWCAMAALARWTAVHAYTPIREIDEATERERELPGLSFQVATRLTNEMIRQAKSSADVKSLPLSPADLQNFLLPRVDAFTLPIRGSLQDVDDAEVNKDHPNFEFRAMEKRQIDPSKFNQGFLLTLVSGPKAGPVAPGAGDVRGASVEGSEKPEPEYDAEERLAQLKKFVDSGLITPEDYEAKKAEILSRF